MLDVGGKGFPIVIAESTVSYSCFNVDRGI